MPLDYMLFVKRKSYKGLVRGSSQKYLVQKALEPAQEWYYQVEGQDNSMSKKIVDEKHAKEVLKEMINERKTGQPVEEVLAIFCQRYSLTMAACRTIYYELVKKGDIKEK
jgi:hypothetical protein